MSTHITTVFIFLIFVIFPSLISLDERSVDTALILFWDTTLVSELQAVGLLSDIGSLEFQEIRLQHNLQTLLMCAPIFL